jgi:hypothetical protein
MARNISVSIMQLNSTGVDMYLGSGALIHLCVVPMCTALANTGTKKESANRANNRKPKMTVMILFLRKTAWSRRKNRADVDGTAMRNAAPMVPITALQFGTFAATFQKTSTLILEHFCKGIKVYTL